jgi:prepilin-type N-terminal cleavage/methylation domain-containing protein
MKATSSPKTRPEANPAGSTRTGPMMAPGFTLIELLTVIAIIGILAAILIPTVGAVRANAYKARCTSNLRNLGTAANLYRNDNRGRLPDGQGVDGVGTANHGDLQRIGADFRDTMCGKLGDPKSGYGMTWEMFFCPGNQSYTTTWKTESQRTADTTSIPIGYLYFPGTTVNVATSQGPSTSIYNRLAEPLGYRLMAADLNRQFNNSWAGGVNHATGESPVGGNHLYVDGSVKWVDASEFIASPGLSVSGTRYYFKTEDIR